MCRDKVAVCTISVLAFAFLALWANEDMASGTFYRKAVWISTGFMRYTRDGYSKASRNFNQTDLDVDISRRSYMITGANSGIGMITALALAKKGATVHMVCRNSERGETAKQEIIGETNNENIHLHLLDISKPGDVVTFTDEFVQSGQQLDVLVNNAGCMVNQREFTDDRLEKNFATNTLGTYIMTTGLLPALEKSSDARVITVSSGGMYVMKLDPQDLQFAHYRNFDGTFAYAQNKRAQIVMSRLWSLKWPDIHFSTMHPGWADTPAVQQSMPSFHARMGNRLRSPEQGADTIIWLCIAEAARKLQSGQFYEDRSPVPEHLPLAQTHSTAEEEELLMTRLQDLSDQFKATPTSTNEDESGRSQQEGAGLDTRKPSEEPKDYNLPQ